MYQRIKELLKHEKIELVGLISLDSVPIQKPYLLERTGITGGSVVIFAMPYYTPACDGERNLSAYAVGRDYHLYFAELSSRLLEALTRQYPHERFAAFADHSPIDERTTAARAGLGKIGKNGLLITEKYSSYVFLGEIITSASLGDASGNISFCEGCHACLDACPLRKGECRECLSALTQKKGERNPNERQIISAYGSAWGCDICQEVCPHTLLAQKNQTLYTPIDFFYEKTIPSLTTELLHNMSETEFSERAYSRRTRSTVAQNLEILEENRESRGTKS